MNNPSMRFRVGAQLASAIMALGMAACSHDGVKDGRRRFHRQWAEGCQINAPCEPIRPLSRCSSESVAFISRPNTPAFGEDTAIGSVLGTVQFSALYADGSMSCTDMACETVSKELRKSWKFCCNKCMKEAALLRENGTEVALPDFGCFGDVSQMCCNIDIKGQKVIATGLLRYVGEDRRSAIFEGPVELCGL
jgi:hypothetical protein